MKMGKKDEAKAESLAPQSRQALPKAQVISLPKTANILQDSDPGSRLGDIIQQYGKNRIKALTIYQDRDAVIEIFK